MAKVADTYLIYQVLKRLTTPFEDTKAFELGLINKDGKLLKKPKDAKEKDAYTFFDRFIFNLKRILHKFGLKSKFASYGAALFLLKEYDQKDIPSDIECYNGILNNIKYLKENSVTVLQDIREEAAPANATGPAVAGTGDDPVTFSNRHLRYKRNKVGRKISALNFFKRRAANNQLKMFKSSYPAGMFKVEEKNPRISRKPGQPAKSDKHSDLYTDEDPKGTIHGLKFATVQDAKDSVSKIENSSRSHAHKIQAAVAMEQRAKVAGKSGAAAIYRVFINKMKKKTKEMNESLYANIHKKRREGRRMRKKGAKGAPKPSDFDRAAQTAKEEAPVIGGVKMKKLGKGPKGSYKSLVQRHLGAKAAEKIDKSDGSKLVAKGKKTGNKELVKKGNFIRNIIGRK